MNPDQEHSSDFGVFCERKIKNHPYWVVQYFIKEALLA